MVFKSNVKMEIRWRVSWVSGDQQQQQRTEHRTRTVNAFQWWEEQSRHLPFWESSPPTSFTTQEVGWGCFSDTVIRQGFSDGLENEQADYPHSTLESIYEHRQGSHPNPRPPVSSSLPGKQRANGCRDRSWNSQRIINNIMTKTSCSTMTCLCLWEDGDVTCSLSVRSQNIESRLKVLLPDDVGAALMDGVVLCHLANHICPRSVASIHVPSPAVVSTLTLRMVLLYLN